MPGGQQTMHVAVAIVGFRNPDDIARCLAALATSDHADFEVAICENGGQQAFEALRSRLPESLPGGQPVRAYEAPGNLGYAAGVNLCIRVTPDADAWWILNPDTQPSARALAALIERLSVGDVQAVGGVLHGPEGRVQLLGGRWRAWLARPEAIGAGMSGGIPSARADIEPQLSFVSGASMLVSRRFVEVAGPMHEDYFLYCEEVEWCLRAQRRGLKLGYAPLALVLHEHGSTTGAGTTLRARPKTPVFLDERNKMLLTRDLFPARLPIAAAAALLLILLRFGARGAWRQVGYGIAGWWAGLRNQRGRPPWIAA